MMGEGCVRQALRCLVLVVAVLSSWVGADPARAFTTAPTRSRPSAARITWALPAHEVTPSPGRLFDNALAFSIPQPMTSRTLGDQEKTPVTTKVEGATPSSFRRLSCPDSASAVLHPVIANYSVPSTGILRTTIYYGELALRFRAARRGDDSLCTLVSQRAALPIIAEVRTAPDADATPVASQQIAASVTTATLDFIPTPPDIRRCDLSLMQSLGHADIIDSTKPLPAGSQECYLNESRGTATNGLTARWSIPGFEEYTPDERGLRVYKTQALTYYVDLNTFLGSNDVSVINSAVVDCLENYIHRTLIKNLPALTPIGVVNPARNIA